MDLLIKNAVVVTAEETFKADVGIRDGRFVKIGDLAQEAAKEVIDAEGNYLFPGVIDVHTHLEHTSGKSTVCDDFADGTLAAAHGGVTTIIDFAIPRKGQSVLECIKNKKSSADAKVYIDYCFHACYTDVNEKTIAEIPEIVELGIPSIKVFMTFSKEGFMVKDSLLFKLLNAAKKYGAMVGVHAENDSIIEDATRELKLKGQVGLPYYPLSRPVLAEKEAIGRVLTLAEEAESPIYIYHLSSGDALEKIKQAQEKRRPVFTETNPHYLLLTEQVYGLEEAEKFVMSPPLRSERDQRLLWDGINTGSIQIISTDHCPYTLEQKAAGAHDFSKVPPGIPGVETLLSLIYSEGVLKKKITLPKMVEVLSRNPAKIFGLETKGSITIGKDADFVIFNPNLEITLSRTNLHMKSDYTPFEGFKVFGYPVVTGVRGKVLCRDGQFFGEKGYGKFIKRKIIAD